ncbi:MAG TPA: hypothetical protein VHZ81_04435 [Galbitalea sp.]|jgi:hypothetical protein|nr:hypothetical protein [Galbitalea sp.]
MTMIELDYQFTDGGVFRRRRFFERHSDVLTDPELRYGALKAHLTFRVGDCDFIPYPAVGRYPVLDFADVMLFDLRLLLTQSHTEFDFLEGEGEIWMDRKGESVSVSSSGTPCVAVCGFDELAIAFTAFGHRVVDDVKSINPQIVDTAAFQKIESRMFWSDVRDSDVPQQKHEQASD